MKFVILPDHGSDTKARMHDLAFSLCDEAESVRVHHYDHWHSGSKGQFPDSEFDRFIHSATAMEKAIFVSDGRGAELVLSALQKNSIDPVACVFIGAPARAFPQTKKILEKARIPNLFLKRFSGSETRSGKQVGAASRKIRTLARSISKRQAFKPQTK